MLINLVMKGSIPMPPDSGTSSGMFWHLLAQESVLRGHKVTIFSRSWPGCPNDEIHQGVRYRRLPGSNWSDSYLRYLIRDFIWSMRVFFALGPADITIVNGTFLPVWLGWIRKGTGRLVIMPQNLPHGQYRLYGRLDCLFATSSFVGEAIARENGRLADKIQVVGQPIDWTALSSKPKSRREGEPVTIGYVGRIHRDKGMNLLIGAAESLAKDKTLPPWRLILCGNKDQLSGGSGEMYAASLERRLSKILPADRFSILHLPNNLERRYAIYREIDIFAYPVLPNPSEVFGIHVVEAMAAGAVPVVSSLKCFNDYLTPGESCERFDHSAPNAVELLTRIFQALLLDPERRKRLADMAQRISYRYDYQMFITRILSEFATLVVSR